MKILLFILLSLSITVNAQVILGIKTGKIPTPEPPDPPPVDDGIYVQQSYVGTSTGTEAQPWKTITDGAAVAINGNKVIIKNGTYRETVTPTNNGVTFEAYPGHTPVISGLNTVGTSWTVHSGSIYKTTISLPTTGFNEFNGQNSFGQGSGAPSNTLMLANQIFKGGEMMHLARWPNVSTVADLFDKSKFRSRAGTSQWTDNNITDIRIGALGIGNLTGAYIWMNGWFVSQTRQISSHSGNNITFPTTTTAQQPKFGKFYFLTNHLGLLDAEKEWFYDGSTLYFRQVGGGSPTNVEYKARNWGFNLQGKTGIKIIGLNFVGCDPVMGNTSTSNTIVDGIRATYMNHAFLSSAQGNGGDARNANQTGTKLIGSNNVLKNSSLKYASTQGVWLGNDSMVDSTYFAYIGYEGMWGAPVRLWGETDNQKILHCTMSVTGRGGIELASPPDKNHTGVEIAYNDISGHNALSIDGGAVYSQAQSDHTGSRFHHNYLHDPLANLTGGIDGVQVAGFYLDQASGPAIIDHNIIAGGWSSGSSDFYSETRNEHRDANTSGNFKYFNNTNYSNPTYATWITYANPSIAIQQRNNIYYSDVISTVKPLDLSNSILKNTNPLFTNSGSGIARFQLQAGSPARNIGVAIPPYTNGFEGSAPDAGALEYGQTPFVVGCTGSPNCN